MKPMPVRNKKTGQITSFQLRKFIGYDDQKKQKFATRTWKPEPKKKYNEQRLFQEANKQQILFEKEVTDKGVSAKGQTAFDVFSERWIEEVSKVRHKTRTTSGYVSLLKRINEDLGSKQLDELNAVTLNAFFKKLQGKGMNLTDKDGMKGLSAKSVRNYYALISAILSTAVEWDLLPAHPLQGKAILPRPDQHEVEALEKEEVLQLFDLLDDEPLKYQLFIKLAVYSGARRGELCGLRWDCVDFDNRSVDIKRTLIYTPEGGIQEDTTKTRSSKRVIRLPDSIFDLLQTHKRQQDTDKNSLGDQWDDGDYVFTQWNGLPMHPNTPYTWFDRFQKAHGFKHTSIHALRHTAATLLIMNGANIKQVAGRLGHSNTSTTTNIYTSYLKSADEQASEILDEVLKK